MCNSNYDEDDYEVEDKSQEPAYTFFGDIEEDEEQFDVMLENMDSELDVLFDADIMNLHMELVQALGEGNRDRAERLQDEIDLMLMEEYEEE